MHIHTSNSPSPLIIAFLWLVRCRREIIIIIITWNMPLVQRAPVIRRVTTRNSHDHRYHQTSLSRARDGTGRKKRNGRKDQREWLCMFQNGKPVSDFILHAWCVGRNFCGYLILRFFPNRKNSQNIVPANKSRVGGMVPRRPVGLPFTHALAWLLAINRSGSREAAVRAFWGYTSGPLIEFEVWERVI